MSHHTTPVVAEALEALAPDVRLRVAGQLRTMLTIGTMHAPLVPEEAIAVMKLGEMGIVRVVRWGALYDLAEPEHEQRVREFIALAEAAVSGREPPGD